MTYMPQLTMDQRNKAYALLKEDADKILRLIEVQMDNAMSPQCPLYAEVLDTQMLCLSREMDLAVILGLISDDSGPQLLDTLEHKLSILHNAAPDTLEYKN